jgi:5-oxoprolinase (ATP-hydrolysing) subunit C
VSAALRVRAAGPGVTLQDGGRHGLLRYGVTVAGPMDPLALAAANLALGRQHDAVAIEISLGGLEITADGVPVDVAVAGGEFTIRHDGRALPSAVTLRLQPEQRLTVRAGTSGTWAYLAFAADLDLPPVLGSHATHTRSRFGGLEGRALRAGDRLPLTALRPRGDIDARIVAPWLERNDAPIRVLLGPQDDFFAPDQIASFLSQNWCVGGRSDRMAYALDGKPLSHAKGHDIVSDGIAHGAVQVPGSGLPFVLMADRQPTGGYPKIANVIAADIGRFAQLRPGAMVRFAAIDRTGAVLQRRQIQVLRDTGPGLEPLVRTVLSPEHLLASNLISGVVDACSGEPANHDFSMAGARNHL